MALVVQTKPLKKSSLAYVESIPVPLVVQEIVLSADIHCTECHKRLAEIMSRIKNMESVSVTVNMLEKNVTITCRYQPERQVVALQRNPFRKLAMVTRIIRFSRN